MAVGVVGDQSLTRFSTGAAYRRLLVEVLARDYPLDHEVVVYRAATLPIQQPRMDRVALGDLPGTSVELPDTLVIPPAGELEIDAGMLKTSGDARTQSQAEMRAPEFRTARLRMRPLSECDQALFCRLYTDAESMRFIGRPLSRTRALAAFHSTLQSIREENGGCAFSPSFRRRAGAPWVCVRSSLWLGLRSAQNSESCSRARAGAALRRRSRIGAGHAAFRALPIDRLWVQYHPANLSAKRLFARLSFLPEPRARPRGVRRGHVSASRNGLHGRGLPCHQEGIVQMSNGLSFLENIGRSAKLRHASAEQLQLAMHGEQIAPAMQSAILNQDRRRLKRFSTRATRSIAR
jgi:RimJ/RimL family protein N-acetyltransferase